MKPKPRVQMSKKKYKLSEQARRKLVERTKRLNADPEFVAARSERMKRLHANPVFAAKLAAGVRKSLKRLWADPEFRAAASERMKRLRAEGKLGKLSRKG